ncbi:hypothetical protein [Natrarchaeobius chitinivorans]|uniref:hypothetical protein n=1 Tax=Natrarchaeobius chitinivorans TaxID=1679083 RepID=UPI000F5320F5|nr:hypothetical protein [Natrarchaeobius chitinivorans]
MTIHYPKRALEILQNGGSLELFKRSIRFLNKNIRRKIQYTKYDAVPDFGRVYSVPVSGVNYTLWDDDLKHYFGGEIPPERIWTGEWHKLKKDFSTTYIHRSFRRRFCKGKEWEQTPYYEILRDGGKYNEYQTAIEYLNKYENIYHNIKQNGYCQDGYISVYIGPAGEYIRKDGAHRLSIAKIIDSIDMIPVKVHSIHKEWQELRDRIYNNGIPKEHEELRDHPGLQDVLN